MSRGILENLRRSKRKNELNRPGELQARYGYAVARMRPRGGYEKSRLLDTDVGPPPSPSFSKIWVDRRLGSIPLRDLTPNNTF